MAFNPYLNFPGTCREALNRYHEIFGGDLTLFPMSEMPGDVPPEQRDLIMHGAITLPHGLLMASDDPEGTSGGGRTVWVNCAVDSVDEAERIFEALAEGGEVVMPIAETFWSPKFGMCVDRFGIPWMVNAEPPQG